MRIYTSTSLSFFGNVISLHFHITLVLFCIVFSTEHDSLVGTKSMNHSGRRLGTTDIMKVPDISPKAKYLYN